MRRRAFRLAAGLALAGVLSAAGAFTAAPPASAAGWAGFYTPSERPAPAPARQAVPQPRAPLGDAGAAGVCVAEILRAQLRHGIPGNILLGIGLQEAGTRRGGQLTIWPWAVNAAGEGRIFDSREAALDWVQARQAAGVRSIDVGCLQVNLRWHPEAFASPAQGFDPARNIDYAARFLRSLYEKTGDWRLAAGSYHSFTPEKRDIYLASLERNLRVANQRIDAFRALAARAPVAEGPAPQLAEAAPRPQPQPRWTGPTWSAALSGGRHGIYSRTPIQPVLPVFTAVPQG